MKKKTNQHHSIHAWIAATVDQITGLIESQNERHFQMNRDLYKTKPNTHQTSPQILSFCPISTGSSKSYS